jgi:hypothetical protein
MTIFDEIFLIKKQIAMRRHKDIIGTVQSVSFIVAYIFVVFSIFLAGWYGLCQVIPEPGALLALYIILFLLAGGLLGAWLWVLVKIPQGLAREYDVIKNKIASREIANTEDFSRVLAEFLVVYFSFFRFDVVAALVKVKDQASISYPEGGLNIEIDDQDLIQKSQLTEALINLGKVSVQGQKLYGYLVPIWFGREWLGYFCVFTDTRLLNIFADYLKLFEEQFVDDQLMHVLPKE